MLGNSITLNHPPRRIISLVPSQTELLYDLGLNEEVVGITKFCVHPDEWFRSKKKVGGTKTVHIDVIKSLSPDLIIANKEENTKEQIEELSAKFSVWVSNIQTVEDGLRMIHEVGILVGKTETAQQLTSEIRSGFAQLKKVNMPMRVAYFIWRKPWMCAGGDTFISDIIKKIGWDNVLAEEPRYPEISLEQLIGRKPDIVLLSSEPYPFKDTHIAEIKATLPNASVLLVDGEMFSWYGSRMKKAVPYFEKLIN